MLQVLKLTIALNPIASAAPFIALFGFSVLVVAAIFLKYPSIRVYWRKRNILIYVAVALVLSLIAYEAIDVAAGPDWITFSTQKTQTPIFPAQQNQFSITCNCDGVKDASLYMVVAGVNVTLQTNGQPGYVQLNDTAIQVPFSFHGGGSQTQPIYFIVDGNVSGISFYPTAKFEGQSYLLVEDYLSEIHCTWDPATGRFAMADSYPIAIP